MGDNHLLISSRVYCLLLSSEFDEAGKCNWSMNDTHAQCYLVYVLKLPRKVDCLCFELEMKINYSHKFMLVVFVCLC